MPNLQKYMPLIEAAREIGITRRTAMRWIADKVMPTLQEMNGRHYVERKWVRETIKKGRSAVAGK